MLKLLLNRNKSGGGDKSRHCKCLCYLPVLTNTNHKCSCKFKCNNFKCGTELLLRSEVRKYKHPEEKGLQTQDLSKTT